MTFNMMYTDYKNNRMVLIIVMASSIITHLPWYMKKTNTASRAPGISHDSKYSE